MKLEYRQDYIIPEIALSEQATKPLASTADLGEHTYKNTDRLYLIILY